METRLRRLLNTACGCLERGRGAVASSDTAETPEDPSWRVIAVFLPQREVEAWRFGGTPIQAAGPRLVQR